MHGNKWSDHGSEVYLFVLVILQQFARVCPLDVIFSNKVFFPVLHANLKDLYLPYEEVAMDFDDFSHVYLPNNIELAFLLGFL